MNKPKRIDNKKDGLDFVYNEGYNQACDDRQKYCEHLENKVKELEKKNKTLDTYMETLTKETNEQDEEIQAIKEENAILKKGTTMSCEACNQMARENKRYREALEKIADEARNIEDNFSEGVEYYFVKLAESALKGGGDD